MKKIGIIGCGNMGRVMVEQLKNDYHIFVFDKDKNKIKDVLGVNRCKDIRQLLEKSEVIILAVKPGDFEALLSEIKGQIKNKLIISIAAGITIKYLQQALGMARVIRVMPNMPAKVNAAMTCLSKGEFAGKEDLGFAEELFAYLGRTLVIDEKLMNAGTAVSGSGPGYLYDWAEAKTMAEIKKYAKDCFIPGLTAAAEDLGFTLGQAKKLAQTTARGSIAVLEKTGLSAGELKQQVASKGGTTEAGLEVLHSGGTLEDAVKAAVKKAEEICR